MKQVFLKQWYRGHKSRKNANSVHQPKAETSSGKNRGESDNDEMDSMVHNNMKSARRKRRGRRYDEEVTIVDATETTGHVGKDNGLDSGLHDDETWSYAPVVNESSAKGDDKKEKSHNVQKQAIDRKETAKSNNSSKGRTQKATSKTSAAVCDTCREDFESRNRLHKHLGDTGHATLKSR
ncbi:DNAJ protein JJJ1 homolog isoform X1 [Actinidia eriantha]|uniref:DNAJ protein JJJ1 homolog isoform X1 n=1 Tax=Actinidia eriantha TaxID=165200 RepID=UPI0025887ED2|nr:DNAJ protein JJJ1 homolog isoform X1 [Actinidia eriantha]XP_057491110.1 DNAJ protein JJJ1 homolog isoform X1 [Actinidia eriantha]